MSTDRERAGRRVTVRDLLEAKRSGQKIVTVTAYDYTFGRLVDAAGVDMVLVGDSLGQVILGYDSTIPVTLEDMVHHARAVRRGVERALLVVDLPFLSFQVSPRETVRNAGRLLKETGAEAVKMEGGDEVAAEHARALTRVGIPVLGHLGFTPQSVHALGGPRVQGRDEESAQRLRQDAARLEAAGCFGIVLELLPAALAGEVSRSLTVPTIGIGAGPHTDGQVLVLYDLLGLNEEFRPRFLRRFAELAATVREGVGTYAAAVRRGEYPAAEHSFE